MKKLFIALITGLTVFSAQAQHHHGHRHHWHHKHAPRVIVHDSWGHIVVPLIIGGVVGAAIAKESQPPAPPVVLATPPVGYRWETILDANCNCQRVVLVPN